MQVMQTEKMRDAIWSVLKWYHGSSIYPSSTTILPTLTKTNTNPQHTMDHMHTLNKQQQHTCAFCMHAVNASHWNTRINVTHKSAAYMLCAIDRSALSIDRAAPSRDLLLAQASTDGAPIDGLSCAIDGWAHASAFRLCYRWIVQTWLLK